MANVFVMGGWLPNGGAFMAYEIASLLRETLHDHQGGSFFIIQARNETAPSNFYHYTKEATLITLDTFFHLQTSDDFLILNPSFHKPLFSLKTNCKIISYIQHYTTFPYLDLEIEHMVTNSQFVKNYVHKLYNRETPLIHPFIPKTPEALKFIAKKDRFYQSPKGFPESNETLLTWIIHKTKNPNLISDTLAGGRALSRPALLNEINQYRFFLTLTIAEGFGMIPLEAMAMGSIPIGVDGYGGQDYFDFGVNSLCLPQDKLSELPYLLDHLNDFNFEDIRHNAIETAQKFTRENFLNQWQSYFFKTGIIT